MKGKLIRIWAISISAAIIALLLIFYGVRLLTTPSDASSGGLFFMGIATFLAGIFVLAAQIYVPRKFEFAGLLLVLGIYFFFRASGVIEGAWIVRILGILCLIGAGTIGYVGFVAAGRIR